MFLDEYSNNLMRPVMVMPVLVVESRPVFHFSQPLSQWCFQNFLGIAASGYSRGKAFANGGSEPKTPA